MGGSCSQVDDELLNDIHKSIQESVANIPETYATERQGIIDRMQQAAPNPYKNLLFADYPEKNRLQVNALAWNNVVTEEAKKKIVDEVYEKIQPIVDEKTADRNSLVREALQKATKKTIEKLVEKTLDELSKNVENMITRTK